MIINPGPTPLQRALYENKALKESIRKLQTSLQRALMAAHYMASITESDPKTAAKMAKILKGEETFDIPQEGINAANG